MQVEDVDLQERARDHPYEETRELIQDKTTFKCNAVVHKGKTEIKKTNCTHVSNNEKLCNKLIVSSESDTTEMRNTK